MRQATRTQAWDREALVSKYLVGRAVLADSPIFAEFRGHTNPA